MTNTTLSARSRHMVPSCLGGILGRTTRHGQSPRSYRSEQLLQLRVLCFGLLQDGDVGVGVFPEREEILICRLGFGGVALHGIGSTDLEMRECSNGFVEHNTAMVEDFLELGGGFAALMRG